MIPYNSTSGKPSGVIAYEIGDDFISVRFTNFRTYTYPEYLNDHSLISRMKVLALASNGLSTFIAQNKSVLRYF